MSETPSVLDVISARRDSQSQPGARTDDYRVALAIEGGGNRAAYSAGMALALDELGLTNSFDAIYGTSAGALNGAWLLTGEGQRWLPSWGWPEVIAAGVTDPRRLLRRGPVLDLNLLVNHVYAEITPMNFDAILANPITFHPIATDARTGEPTDLAPLVTGRESLKTALRASSCLPLIAGLPVRLGSHSYLDGGLSEAVPSATAVAQGATHVLVLRTRIEGHRPGGSLLEQLVSAPYFAAVAPGAGASYRRRRDAYLRHDVAPDNGCVVAQVRPPADAPEVRRLAGEPAAISAAVEIGRAAFHDFAGTGQPASH